MWCRMPLISHVLYGPDTPPQALTTLATHGREEQQPTGDHNNPQGVNDLKTPHRLNTRGSQPCCMLL